MPIVYLALGTNLGDRALNLRGAVARLAPSVNVMRVSPIFETEPWGLTEQPRFLNMALEGETELAPRELLTFLKSVEREMGRAESVRYGPRVIDLDMLFYDDQIVSSPELTIPHPRLAERRFVLVPLADLAPELIHPQLGVSVRALLARLPDDGSVQSFTSASS